MTAAMRVSYGVSAAKRGVTNVRRRGPKSWEEHRPQTDNNIADGDDTNTQRGNTPLFLCLAMSGAGTKKAPPSLWGLERGCRRPGG
jgi:hypothetical protein